MRVGIIGLLQESTTFIPERTRLADFERDVLAVGEEVRQRFSCAHHEMSGFFAGLAEAEIEAVPVFGARAVPYGTIAADDWLELMSIMNSALDEAGPLDGLLVAPHGATVSESEPDADGFWLSQLHARFGASVPIIGTLDPHANLSPRMVEATDALIAYRTNPHIDQFETGKRAARLMARTLRREIHPTQNACFPPVVINIERQETAVPPCRGFYSQADWQLQQTGVLSNSILLGFAYADVPKMGSATLVVTDDNPQLAQRYADELASYLWDYREEFRGKAVSVKDALDRSLQLPGPVCLLDTGDNIGGGSPGDSTWLVQSLHERRVGGSLAYLVDPAAVALCEAAGIGSSVQLEVGGHSGPLHGRPLAANFQVAGICDGRFREREPRHGGASEFNQGRTVVVRTEFGLTLIVSSERVPPFSLAQVTSCGLDPAQFQILVAKGVVAPVAAYRTVCKHFIRVATPGVTTTNLSQLHYLRRRRPLFPFESDFEWAVVGRGVVMTR